VGFEQDPKASSPQTPSEHAYGVGLQKRFSPCETCESVRSGLQPVGLLEDLVQRYGVWPAAKARRSPRELDAALARRLPRVRGIAPAAAEIALTETHEERALAHVRSLALHRREDLDEIRRTQAR
jgi:hypothetical protein